MYILLDLEATCWIVPPRPKCQTPEIIEIAALAINKEFQIRKTFQSFIKPDINPNLSLSCMELTNIKQEDIDSAPSFVKTMNNFYQWIPKEDLVIFSWGPFDRTHLLKETKLKKYESGLIDIVENNMKSIDKYFQKKYKLEKGGLYNTLSFFGIEPLGEMHRAHNDVINMYKLFEHCKNDIKDDISRI